MALIRPTSKTIRGISGHSLPSLGYYLIPICMSDFFQVDCEFLTSDLSQPILGLNVLLKLNVKVSSLTVQHDVSDFYKPVLMSFKLTWRDQHNSQEAHYTSPSGHKSMRGNGRITPVESSSWATPIVTPLKTGGKTL